MNVEFHSDGEKAQHAATTVEKRGTHRHGDVNADEDLQRDSLPGARLPVFVLIP